MALFLRFDMSQIESRIVYVLSHDAELIEIARRKPWTWDQHRFVAAAVFEKAEKDITKEERYAGKRISHASNYGGKPARVSEALMDEGFFISVEDVAKRQGAYLKRFPGIGNYQLRTRLLVIEKRRLENSWGFAIEFKYERLDDALWRRAYAFRPQSEAGMLLNLNGIIPAYEFIKKNDLKSQISFAVHDEVAISTPTADEAWDLARLLHESLEAEREYEGERLSIPADLALESRYHGREGEVIEFKMFPEKEAFYEGFASLDRHVE